MEGYLFGKLKLDVVVGGLDFWLLFGSTVWVCRFKVRFKGFASSSVSTPTVSLKTLLTMSIVKDAVLWLGNKARSPFRSSFLCSSGSCKIM